MFRTLRYSLPLALAASATAAPQWVSFTEVTSTHTFNSPNNSHPFPTTGAIGDGNDSEFDSVKGDFNQDGWIDVAAFRKAPNYIIGERHGQLLINRQGFFIDLTEDLASDFVGNPSNARDVVTGDVDGDGDLDLIVVNANCEDPQLYKNRGFDSSQNWLGFELETNWFMANSPNSFDNTVTSCAAVLVDFTNDSYPDLYISTYQGSSSGCPMTSSGQDRLLINNGAGFFIDETSTRLPASATNGDKTGVEVGDLDGDGDLDVVATNPPSFFWAILNNGSGIFNSQQLLPVANGTGPPYMHAITDTDGDGNFDDVFQVTDGRDGSVRSIGAPGTALTWSTPLLDLSRQTLSNGGNVKSADFDNDGKLDLAICELEAFMSPVPTTCNDVNTFSINRNVFGTSAVHDYVDPFVSPQPWQVNGAWDCELADFDLDGDIDLLISCCEGWRYFLNDLQ